MADGRFVLRESSDSTTYINTDPMNVMGGGVMGASSFSSADGGTGLYGLKDNWLVMQFDGGRLVRRFVYPANTHWTRADGPPEQLVIDGVTLPLINSLGPGVALRSADDAN